MALSRAALAVVGTVLLISVAAQDLGPNEAEILWDTWGVPHITGDTLPAASYASGRATARLHGNLLLELIAHARGNSSALFGPGEGNQNVFEDSTTHGLDLPRMHEAIYAQLDDDIIEILDTYAQGVNEYIAEFPTEFDGTRMLVLPISGFDVSAHLHRIFTLFAFGNSRDNSISNSAPAGASLLDMDTDELGSRVIHAHELDLSKVAGGAFHRKDGFRPGSNVMGLTGDLVDGKPKLVQNPHLPYTGFFRWMEMQFTVESEDLDCYGATLVGFPFPTIAFNDYLGWSHTVNVIQSWVNYAVPLVNATHYFYNGDVLPINTWQVDIPILVGPTYAIQTLSLASTVHGLVFDTNNTHLLASRLAGTDRAHFMRQRLAMLKAKNLDEFRTAMQQHQNNYFHTAGATKDGDVFNYWTGHVPKRNEIFGDWFFWAEPVDGSTNDTFFTEIHEFDELPQVENPPSDWVQNCNEPPWTMTLPPLDPNDYPSYMSEPPYLNSRGQTSISMLQEASNVTLEELVEMKHSTLHWLSTLVLPELIAAIRDLGSDASLNLNNAANQLVEWDGRYDGDSVFASLLFNYWQILSPSDERLRRPDTPVPVPAPGPEQPPTAEAGETETLFSVPWSLSAPLTTPNTLTNITQALIDLDTAWEFLQIYAPTNTNTEYGDMFKLPGGLPGNGHADTFRNTRWEYDNDGLPEDEPWAGDGWVCVVEFGEDGARAKSLLGYGNGSQGPHVNDQWALYANQTLRDVWRSRSDIMANLESQEIVSQVESTPAPVPAPSTPPTGTNVISPASTLKSSLGALATTLSLCLMALKH